MCGAKMKVMIDGLVAQATIWANGRGGFGEAVEVTG
jgi:hypothetical protein